ncbi:hypothetical protein Dxin01_03467 [Deinococcus xinjiangensis]|uniref:WCX domain-containing protein n=1 Tax=Deinococcus xinjiangensis TaxID=457454 RepID=A0ABP9VGE3_9DEIO
MSITRRRGQGQRLLRLIRLLQEDVLDSVTLAATLQCTQQEIQRDLRLLRTEGWNVQETPKRPKRYFLAPEDTEEPDPVRSVVTHALLRMLHHHAPTPSHVYHRAALELSETLPERLREVTLLSEPHGDTPRILETLAAAWCWGQAVGFTYCKPGETPKRGMGDIVYMEVNRTNLDWYVFMRRRGEKRVKTFHLSRFTDAVRLPNEPSPDIPFNPRHELDGAWGIVGGGDTCTITLRFAPEALPWVTHRQWPGQLTAKLEGEHYLLTVQAPLNHQHLPVEVMAWIRGWGPRVEVISPDWVRALWLAEARELLVRYGRI